MTSEASKASHPICWEDKIHTWKSKLRKDIQEIMHTIFKSEDFCCCAVLKSQQGVCSCQEGLDIRCYVRHGPMDQ